MTLKRSLLLIVIVSVLIPTGFFVRAALNYPLVKRSVTNQFLAHRERFERVALEVRDKRVLDVTLGEEKLISNCEGGLCPSLSTDVHSILSMGFSRIYFMGQNVYFVRDEGFGYDMGIVQMMEKPIALSGRGFELVPVDAAWYVYRHSH